MNNLSKSLLLLLTCTFLFTACKKEEDALEQREPFVGAYAVKQTSTTNGKTEYSMTIAKSATDKNTVEIANFADVIKKKVLAVVNGNNFTIPSQTFVSGKSQIIITGSGSMNGKILHLTYVVKGDFNWDAVCVSTKQQ
ncbi:MAG: hypothetical protein V4714_13965 [Bacteroidota bacterium]